MGARTFQDLVAWQIARELRVEIFRLTAISPLSRDLKLRSQIETAAGSVCRNIAEGFGRLTHAEFDRFLTMGRGSVKEVQDGLIEMEDHGYLTCADTSHAHALARKTEIAIARLSASLRHRPDPPWNQRPRRR